MPDPTLLSIVLAVLAGVLAAVKRLERADWVLPLPWVDLALAVAFAVTAGAFDDPAWWVAAVAVALGLFGFGFLAGAAALTLVRLPDPELMAMTVVPLLVGFALHHFLRAANGKQLPFEAAERDSARSDLRWSLAAKIAPVVPFALVLGVPLPGGDLADAAVRLLGAAVIALYLVAVDRIRVALLRPRRRILRAAELNNALVATVLAASPIGAEAVAWWGRTLEPLGWEWYRLVAVVFSVFVVLAVLIGNNMVRGPLLFVVLALGHLARLAVAAGLVLTGAIALLHPDRDLLVPAVIGGLPALVIGWLSIGRGRVFRQLTDAALLSTLTESKRGAVIDTWVTEKVVVAAPDLSLPDAVGALALRSLADERAQPPWLVRTDEAIAVADALLDAVDRRVALERITDDRIDRARFAARGDLALWQAKIRGERGDAVGALAAAKDALTAFDAAGARFGTALAWSAVADHAEADPDLDVVAEIDGWLAAHDLPAAARRHATGSAARAAADRGDLATARDRLHAARRTPAPVAAFAAAMRADRVHFGATPRELCGIMLLVERQVLAVVTPR